MPDVPDLRLAICRRCRWPERRAKGAATDLELRDHARARCREDAVHVRISQCLNCCDGGHTVRIELHGNEVAIVGIRTTDELDRVIDCIEDIGHRNVPENLKKRVYQVWVDGQLVFHLGHG